MRRAGRDGTSPPALYHELAPGGRITLQDLTHTEMLLGLKTKKLNAALTLRPRPQEMRGLRFEMVSRHAVGIICSAESPMAGLLTLRPSVMANNELIVYRAKDFPESHKWIAGILGVSPGELIVLQECDELRDYLPCSDRSGSVWSSLFVAI